MKTEENNPFLIKGYGGKDLFCDREKELAILLDNCRNGADTTLISLRRMGKTGLILRLFDELLTTHSGITPIYVDIYATRSLADFIECTAEAVMKSVPKKTTVWQRFWEFVKGLRPQVSYDSISGDPSISLTYQTEQEKVNTLSSIFEFLDKQNMRFVMAYDEFQQIREYPENNVEAILRTHIQQLKNVNFIFCGSKKHLMADIFANAKKPFYSSTSFLSLDKISEESYTEFIKRLFSENNRDISDEAVQQILQWTSRYTFYTQNLCHKIYSMGIKDVKETDVMQAAKSILEQSESYFLQYRSMLTDHQWSYLIAVAKEQEVEKITAQNFLTKHNIGSAATSRRLLQSLLEKELIVANVGTKSTTYSVYDIFLKHWLRNTY